MSPTSSHSLRPLHEPLAESLKEVRLIRTLKLHTISEKADSINFSMTLRDFSVNLVTKPTIYLLKHLVVISVTNALINLVSSCNALEFHKDVRFDALLNQNYCFFDSVIAPSGPEPPHSRGFTITLRHTTLGRTPVDE
jgi:hypothetical protein